MVPLGCLWRISNLRRGHELREVLMILRSHCGLFFRFVLGFYARPLDLQFILGRRILPRATCFV